ncbi:IucA/IucC family protein [Vibrio sp. 10N.286.48.C11]|uniref:IucA/IucC family protein n=1 Tax=Vibrio sp. 10N.286.48.C11 TaxID=3229698 RepID=UPI00354E81CC
MNYHKYRFLRLLLCWLIVTSLKLIKIKKRFFLQRVENSNDYVARASSALALRQSKHDLQGFITSEQALSGGHSMHPAPKCNEPLTQQEQEAYLPEFAGDFAVEWFAVKEDKLAGEYVSGSLKYELKEMFLSCHAQGGSLLPDAEWVPIPMHPLQAREWRKALANCQFFCI